MRAAIRTAIVNDATLQSLGVVPEAVYAGDVDTPPERPYVVLRWGSTGNTGIAQVQPRFLTVWVHDKPNDYELVDAIIRRIRTVLAGLIGTAHDTGWFVDIEWTGDSDDLVDESHGTILRQSRYTLMTSGN